MTNAELQAIRERNDRRKSYRGLTSPCGEADQFNDDVDALLAEVDRLRQSAIPQSMMDTLRQHVEDYDYCYLCCNHPGEGHLKHAPGCPLAARKKGP